MANPTLLEQFCSSGQKDAVSSILQTAGWSPENPNINGYQLNTIFNEIYTYLNYLKNKGLSFWESTKTYKATTEDIDIVRYANKIYFAKQDSNLDGTTPMQPDTNPTYWGVLYDLDKPLESTYALLGGSATQTFKVANGVNADEAVSKGQLENTTHTFTARQKITSGGTNALELSRPSSTLYNGIQFSTNNIVNFLLYQKNNADGDLLFQTRLDDGTIIGAALSISRSTAVVNFPINATISSNQIWHSGNCTAQKSTNGYQKLANGMVMQWGEASVGANTTLDVTLPIAFAGTFAQVLASSSATNPSAQNSEKVGASKLNLSTVRLGNQAENTLAVRYFAIGY